jgi:tripartite-type tricarboxylate transporter receptor subunit TctC
MNRFRRFFLSMLALPLLASVAAAQDWPTRNLRLVVPFPAGGSADVQARVIAEELSRRSGNRSSWRTSQGAGGNIGAADAARAAPDGYTLFMATTGTHSSNISLYPKLPYDPEKDFAPLTLVTIYPQVIVPGEKYPQKTLPELVDALKQAGSAANFGSSGVGSPTHLGGELFKRQTGTQMMHVPYRGQGPALNDLLAAAWTSCIAFEPRSAVLRAVRRAKLRADRDDAREAHDRH